MSILIKNFQFKKRYQVALLLGISAIVGIMRFIVYLIPRSKPESQLIWGLSAARFFLGIVFLGLLLINIGAVIFALKDFFPAQKKNREKTKRHIR